MKVREAIYQIAAIVALSANIGLAAQSSPKDATVPGDIGTYDEKTSTKKKTTVTPDRQILFFINPNGRPCQIQDSILVGMKSTLKPLATVKQISTMVQEDRKIFYQYGIRALPSLIITDKSGKEVKRFTPGIKDEKTILAELKKAN